MVCNPISWMRRMPLYSTHILKEMFPIDGAASLDRCGMEWILVPASNENGLLSCKSCSVLDVACVLVRSGYAMEAAVLLWKARELSPEFFAVHTALKRFRREVLSVSNAAARVPHGSGWRELLNTVEHVVDDIVGTAL